MRIFMALLIVSLFGGMQLADAGDVAFNAVPAVQKRINLDSRIDSSNIRITGHGNKVVLSGTVGSIIEKQLAEEVAKGVVGDSYSVSGLKVVPPMMSDSDIERSIETSVPAHCQVQLRDFNVQVKDGNVTLTGQTDALHHSTVAGYVASTIRGVKGVTNRIVVNDKRASDKLIRENILSLLSPRLDKNEISNLNITVVDGKVTLNGSVENYGQEKYIREVSENVPGAVSVKNDLRRTWTAPDPGGRY